MDSFITLKLYSHVCVTLNNALRTHLMKNIRSRQCVYYHIATLDVWKYSCIGSNEIQNLQYRIGNAAVKSLHLHGGPSDPES